MLACGQPSSLAANAQPSLATGPQPRLGVGCDGFGNSCASYGVADFDTELVIRRRIGAALTALRNQGVARNEGLFDGLKGWVRV